jgi:uncharacterized protein (TIRG00374 family)
VTRQFLVHLAKYAVGLALLAFVVWRNWEAPAGGVGIADAIQRPVQLVPLTLALSICALGLLLTFIRWYFLVRALDLPFTLANSTRLGLVGYFLSIFLPGSIGGDIIKAACIAREQTRRTLAVASVIVDRVVGLVGLVWLVALLGAVFWVVGNHELHHQYSLQIIVGLSWSLVAASLAFWAVLGMLSNAASERFAAWLAGHGRVGATFGELWRAAWLYRCRGATVFLAVCMSMVGHVGFVLAFYFAAQTLLAPAELGSIPSMAEHFLVVPIGMTIQAVVPVPGGLGIGEMGFGELYHLLGKPRSLGVLAAFVSRALTWVLAFVGYLLYLRMKPTLPVAEVMESPTADPVLLAMRTAPSMR